METLTSKAFGECLQSNFAVDAPGGSVAILLVEVTEGVNTDMIENFSLVFRGPISPFFRAATYRLCHQKLGTIDLFLVPIGPDRYGMQYEAVFSHVRAAELRP